MHETKAVEEAQAPSRIRDAAHEIGWAWANTLLPYTTAYAVGSAALAAITKHPELLVLTAHGIYESAVETLS